MAPWAHLQALAHTAGQAHCFLYNLMELVRNRCFTLTTGNGAQSSLRRLQNGVLTGSVLAPLFLTSTPMTCLLQLPGSLFTQATWPSCTLQETASRWRYLLHRKWQPYHRQARSYGGHRGGHPPPWKTLGPPVTWRKSCKFFWKKLRNYR